MKEPGSIWPKSRRIYFAAIAVGLVLGACSPEAEMSDELADQRSAFITQQIEFVRERTDSSFVLQIIEDGDVTTSEFQESMARTNQCIADAFAGAGVSPGTWGGFLDADGLRDGEGDPDNAGGPFAFMMVAYGDDEVMLQELMDECDLQYAAGVPAIYLESARMVDTFNAREATVACLIDRGLVDSSFTIDHLKLLELETAAPTECEAMINDDRFINVVCGEDGSVGGERNPDYVFVSKLVPGAPDIGQPPALDCVYNP